MLSLLSPLSLAMIASVLAPPVLVVGHRGAPAEFPESTLVGIERALAFGYVEVDVRVTADDVLVIHHDATVSPRCVGPGDVVGKRIRELTFAKLRELDCGARDPAFPQQRPVRGAQIPTLEEALDVVRQHQRYALVELKADDAPPVAHFAQLVAAAAERVRRGRTPAPMIIESFDVELLRAVRSTNDRIALGLLVGHERKRPISDARELGAFLISPVHTRVTREFLDEARAANLIVVPWTVNDEAEQRRLVDLGVRAIVTDDPAALAARFPERRKRQERRRRRLCRLRPLRRRRRHALHVSSRFARSGGSGCSQGAGRARSRPRGLGRALAVVAVALGTTLNVTWSSACSTTSTGVTSANHVVVTRGSEPSKPIFDGPATFTVRSAREGIAQRVVSLPGLGEIIMTLDDAQCSLVSSQSGLEALELYEGHSGCGERVDGRVCFRSTTFTRHRSLGTVAQARGFESLVVDGCADENDLLWSKLDGASAPATVGPRSFRQRCRPIPQKRGCELVYARKVGVDVASNDGVAGDHGFTLVYTVGAVDGWRACFLERETGPYKLELVVEDSCGNAGPLTLKGDSAELED